TVQSTNGIVVYAFTPTAYNDYKSAGMTTGSSWTSGPIVTGSFSVSLAAGSWYFVFVSPNPAFSTSVLFTGALVATAD
ncbi:MAG TPA: hypothetical protein VMH90_06800, partial [Thermoplasmata archaeon]|nr:hypothetical protein [Thermoplasmata archaeon]